MHIIQHGSYKRSTLLSKFTCHGASNFICTFHNLWEKTSHPKLGYRPTLSWEWERRGSPSLLQVYHLLIDEEVSPGRQERRGYLLWGIEGPECQRWQISCNKMHEEQIRQYWTGITIENVINDFLKQCLGGEGCSLSHFSTWKRRIRPISPLFIHY